MNHPVDSNLANATLTLPGPLFWAVGLLVVVIGAWWWQRRQRGSDTVATLKGLSWSRQTFCQHFLITGETGCGKTSSGIFQLLFQVFAHQPHCGGLCVDVKGVLHEVVTDMAQHFGRAADVIVLRVQPNPAPDSPTPLQRFNLVGDRSIPYGTHARCVVDTATALGNQHEQSFFRQAAQIHIAKGLETLAVLGYEVTLENVHNLLVNPADTRAAIQQLDGKDSTCGLAEHFRNYLAQPPEQLGGIVGTVRNYLHYFTEPAIAAVFCRDSTFALSDVDEGRIICLAIPQKYQTERRFVGTFLKLLFYAHALSRFDASKEARQQHNLLLLLADECQKFVTNSETGLSDHNVVDLVREAGVAIIAATQSTTSLIPVLGAEAAQVFTLNLRNRLIFTAADEADAKASAEFLGKILRLEKSTTRAHGSKSVTLTERESYRIEPHRLRQLRKHQCILVHCEQGYRRVVLPPLAADGTIPKWYRRRLFDFGN